MYKKISTDLNFVEREKEILECTGEKIKYSKRALEIQGRTARPSLSMTVRRRRAETAYRTRDHEDHEGPFPEIQEHERLQRTPQGGLG